MTKAEGANYYYHADGLGSITALTDDNAQPVETYTYKAYGQPTIKDRTGAVLDKSQIGNPYLFTARELDSESGLYYYRARYYDWLRGAFTQEDPLGFSGGDPNHYSYVKNRPSNSVDPSGKIGWMVAGGLISGGIDLAIQYSQVNNFSEINWKSVAISAAAGAIGVGLESQISKIALTTGWRIGLNGLGNAALGSSSRIFTNVVSGKDWSSGALTAGVTSGLFSLGGSALQESVLSMNTYLANMVFDELSLSDKLLLSSNAVQWTTESGAFGKIVNAVGLGVSSMSPLYEGCEK
ncbi:MAG: RHS repeat-associated core domain-containing protein [Elusimicrobia bacterium]|nr:RHS repeat-associated core domain-containing protein [Elusimicrobiota bacterium]